MKAKIDIELNLANSDKKVLVSVEDLDKLEKIKTSWFLSKRGYAQTRTGRKTIMMHRFIMDCPSSLVTHHKDNNKLNNTRDNLKNIPMGENIALQKTRDRTKMKNKYKGVCELKGGYIYARIKVNGIYINAGRFNTQEEAAVAAAKLYRQYGGLV